MKLTIELIRTSPQKYHAVIYLDGIEISARDIPTTKPYDVIEKISIWAKSTPELSKILK